MKNLRIDRYILPRKKFLVNRLLATMLLIVTGIMLLTGCEETSTNNHTRDNSDIPEMRGSVVETAFEVHLDDYGTCRVDIRLPNLNNNLPNADQVNEKINSEYVHIQEYEHIDDCQTAEGYEYVWYQYDYYVADFDGVYSIAIYSTISSAYGSYNPMNNVQSFYYDSKNGEILTSRQFLEKVGYSEDDIISAYINSCCPAYKSEQIDFSQIFFYFNKHNELNFIFNSSSIISQ
ncbi:hypothetical protein ACX1C1_16600 [Paenibacillus sp. strain BS8-2]